MFDYEVGYTDFPESELKDFCMDMLQNQDKDNWDFHGIQYYGVINHSIREMLSGDSEKWSRSE